MAPAPFSHPYPVQFKGSAIARWVLARLGWKIHFEGFPALQGMVVVYPHTSNWDFIYMILVKWALGIQASFWAKDSLFKVPLFGPWLRWVGGVPVQRTSAQGQAAQAVVAFEAARAQGQRFWIGLAPEGTRKHTPGWRSGFYTVAHAAKLPLGLARLDYGRREVRITDFILLTGDRAADMARIAQVYEGVQGKVPARMAPITLLDPKVPRATTVNE